MYYNPNWFISSIFACYFNYSLFLMKIHWALFCAL
jgi:hypothetical protein